jgi:hypothetical protein
MDMILHDCCHRNGPTGCGETTGTCKKMVAAASTARTTKT